MSERQLEERALTMRLLRHQNIGDSEEPVMLAQDLMSANRLRDARLVCMTALHKDPSDVDLLLTSAGIAETLGEHVDARTLLVRAARLVPEWVEPMYRLALLLFRMEDFGRAWAAVERCYSMDPTNAQTCALRADIEQAHRLTLRMERFLHDEHVDDAAMLANALVAESRFDDALIVLDYALERDGEDADALFVKGTILRARGERDKAQAALRRVTQMECGWVEAWETMADVLEENGDLAHAERLRAHAATIEVDPLMLVDMAVIAGSHETAFEDLTMNQDLDRAVAAGVSAMSELKRSIVHAGPIPQEEVPLTSRANPSMLIRDVGAMFADAPAASPKVEEEEFSPESVEAASIPALQFLVDDVGPNPKKERSGGDTLPLGTYQPTTPRPKAAAAAAADAAHFEPVALPKADVSSPKATQTANGEFTAPALQRDSSQPGPRKNAPDSSEEAPITTYAEAMALRSDLPKLSEAPRDEEAEVRFDRSRAEDEGMVFFAKSRLELVADSYAAKTLCAVSRTTPLHAALPPSPLAPKPSVAQPVANPVTVRRIIDVRGRRDEVCVIRDGEAMPLSALVQETDADLDALLADGDFFPSSDAGGDEDLFPVDAEAESFPSIDIDVEFPIDAEAEQFPSIDIDVAPLSEPPAAEAPAPSAEASLRFQMFAYISGPEFERVSAGAHHVGFIATDSFDAIPGALRIRDGKVTLESQSVPALEAEAADATPEASPETEAALADLMDAQISFDLSVESKAAFDELLSLQPESGPKPLDAFDAFDALAQEDADTLFDAPPVLTSSNAETHPAEKDAAEAAGPATIVDMAIEALTKGALEDVIKAELEAAAASEGPGKVRGDETAAIPLVRKARPRHTHNACDDLDIRTQILAAAGVEAEALESALQATRRPSALKEAEDELDCFLEEVVVKRPRLRMRSTKGAPYRPPSPRDLFPKHTVDEEEKSNELNA